MVLGDTIKKLRRRAGMTQEQLAEALCISAQAVSKWETGASCPDVELLPKLALLFHCSMDELFDFDRRKIDEAVDTLVRESVPLRAEPARAEAFYRRALETYPNNEVLLNCLLMVIPNERSAEKLELGNRLLERSEDPEIRCDVLRLLALTCHGIGEQAMAEAYLARLPELYFLKTELAAALREGEARMEAIRKTEDTCFGILCDMVALRRNAGVSKERCDALAEALLALPRHYPDFAVLNEATASALYDSEVPAWYK